MKQIIRELEEKNHILNKELIVFKVNKRKKMKMNKCKNKVCDEDNEIEKKKIKIEMKRDNLMYQ